jgi:L-threonate 2-dehydrogenase
MKRIGIIGLGDMGSGLAKNVIAAGFETSGFDLLSARLAAFTQMGGQICETPRAVGEASDAVFVMVLNGTQAKTAIFGEQGLVHGLKRGSAVIMSATIKPVEAEEIAASLREFGIDFIDSPVSGGYSAAQSGTLTMMVAGRSEVLDAHAAILKAVGKKIFRVGEQAGYGQTVKACLQALIGSIFAATFESAVLAAKSGIPGQVIFDVFSNSAAGNAITNNALQKIIDRAFVGTGSHIGTMYKDLTISLDHARDRGVPLFYGGDRDADVSGRNNKVSQRRQLGDRKDP